MHKRNDAIATVLVSLSMVAGARAGGCDGWLPGPLFHQPEGVDTGSAIFTSTVWDPPNGPPLLVIGGEFTTAGGVTCNSIAAWDGASWRDLGGTSFPGSLNGSVSALAVYNGDLIIAGKFDGAGGVPASNIARFDGTSWHALAGPNGEGLTEADPPSFAHCLSLAVYNGELIAGGHFKRAGGLSTSNIARWNGTQWNAMGFGIGSPTNTFDSVSALAAHNGVLYIGGFFQIAGGLPASNIAQFVNGSYFAMSSGTAGSTPGVDALRSFGNDLIVGGHFTTAGGLSANKVARWTPSGGPGTTTGSWSAMGSGITGTGITGVHVFSIHPLTGQLVAGGIDFPGCVRLWNGSTWSILAGGVSGGVTNQPRVFMLEVFNGRLVAAGQFGVAGNAGTTVTNIAQFDGSFWSALHAPVPQVIAFETLGARIIAGGILLHSTTNSTPAHNLIGWNGTTLTALQSGICCGEGANGTVRALKSFTTGIGAFQTRNLVVGGDFTVAGGLSANRVAQYSEPSLTLPSWSTLGSGFNNSVFALERFNNATYAGGQFTLSGATSVSRIAQFNGTNWIALGSGMNGVVFALKAYNGFLYAGGDFTSAGGVSTGGLARWNGTTWSSVGGFFGGTVYALEVHNNELIIGGQFPGLPGAPNIAKYNGTIYSNLGAGGANSPVTSLKSNGTHVYCLGGFTSAGGVPVNRVARWNATEGWSDVDGGVNQAAQALGVFQNYVHVGLVDQITLAGGGAPQPGNGWVRFGATGMPVITQQPLAQTVDCGQNANFTIALGPSFFVPTLAWRKDGAPLSDGPTGDGSTISGATTASLTISNVGSTDVGAYDCVVTNPCGSATSLAAALSVNPANCPACAGDINGDDIVDVNDLLAVVGAWGATGPNPADVNGDQVVDVNDLLAVIGGWGACP